MSKIGHVDRIKSKEVEEIIREYLPEQGFTVKETRTKPNQRCVYCNVPECRGVAPMVVCIKPEEHALLG